MPAVNYKSLYIAFCALMGLLIATIAINFVPLGVASTWLPLAIAVAKTLLVATFFMGVLRSAASIRLAAGVGVLWLMIGIVLVMADYMSRGWDEPQSENLEAGTHVESFDRSEKVQYDDAR